jgi:hypothetical protein
MDKKVVIEVDVEAGNSINSLKSIKQQLKEAQAEALKGNQDAIKKVAELKDKLDDLKDSTKSLQGSGVEKVTSSFGLLGEGLRNFDFDKIKTGFKGIGTAMSAIPVFLIAEGISYLIENWKELSEGNGVLAKSLQGISWLFEKLTSEIYAITDALGLSNSALDKQGEAIKTNSEQVKESLSTQSAEFDRQIRVAKASGHSTIELEKAKQQAIIDTNLTIANQILAFVKAGGEFDAEKKKMLTASLEAIKGAKVTEFEIEKNAENQKAENAKKIQDKKEKERLDRLNAYNSKADRENAEIDAKEKKEADEKAKLEAERASILRKMDDEQKALDLQNDKDEIASKVAKWAEEDKLNQKKASDEKLAIDASIKNAHLLTDSLQSISDIGYAHKLAKVQKGSKEEEAIMRKQFEVNKKLQMAQTTISTITGAREAYKSLAGIPIVGPGLGIAAAAVATLAGISALQKINSTKFETAPAPSVESGGGGGNINTSAPNTQAPTTQAQPFTRLDESGRNLTKEPTVKAYVVESEMTNSQRRVGKLEGQASFG